MIVLFVKWRNRGKDPYGDIGQETGELSGVMSRQGHNVGLWGTRQVLYVGLCGGHMRVLTLGHVLMLSFMACALFSFVSYVDARKSSRNTRETTYNIEEELTETQFGLEIPYRASKIAKARKNSYFS